MALFSRFVCAVSDDQNLECFVKYLNTRSLLDVSYPTVSAKDNDHSYCNNIVAKERDKIYDIASEFDQNLSPGRIGRFTKCFNRQIITDLQENSNVFDFHLLRTIWTAEESESLQGAAEKKRQADNSFLEKINQFSMACDSDNLGCFEKYLKKHSKLIEDFRGRYKPSHLTDKQCKVVIDLLLTDFFDALLDAYEYELDNEICLFERLKTDSRFIEAPMLAKVWRFYTPNGVADAKYASVELEKLGKPLESILNNKVLDEAMDYCKFRNTFDEMQQLYPDVNRLRRCLQKHLLDFPNFLGEFTYALKRVDNGNDEVGLNCTEMVHNESARIRTHFVEVAISFNVGDKACVEGVFDKQNFSRTIFRVLALGIVEQLSTDEIESEQKLFIDQMSEIAKNVPKCKVWSFVIEE